MRYLLFISVILLSCGKESRQAPQLTGTCQSFEQLSLKGQPNKPEPGMIMLDFDGYEQYLGSGASQEDIDEVKATLAPYFDQWQVYLTTSEAEYTFFKGKKQRIVFTNSGIAFLGISSKGSMANSTGEPVLVWWYATRFNVHPNALAARLATHETGHALGLSHIVDTCGQQYAQPVNRWVPVMGLVVDADSMSWVSRINDQCITEKEIDIINQSLKRKK